MAERGGAMRVGFAAECRAGGWKTVLAGLIGVSLGMTALPFYTFGVFAKPLAAAFGWPQAVTQSGLIFSMIGTVLAAGPAGVLIDRWGVRRVALLSQAGLALGFVLLAFQSGSVLQWRASWTIVAIAAIGTTPLTWSRGIADWFVEARGLALGIALAGSGVTAFLAPLLIAPLIAAHGWQAAYLTMGAVVAFVGLPTTALFFHARTGVVGETQVAAPIAGVAFGDAVRGYRFWLLLAAFAAISLAIGGAIPNLVPMLAKAGVAKPALFASLLGACVIVGRVLSGWLLDRFWAPLVALLLLGLPALGCLLLAWQTLPAVAAGLIGLAAGAEFDLMAYLSARYFGMRAFGRIYAWQWATFSLAAGIGSYAFARSFDASGVYQPALYVSAALMAAGGASLLWLGRYPEHRHG